MDKLSVLIELAREANVWDTLSNEEIIERALTESIYDATGVFIEFKSSGDKRD